VTDGELPIGPDDPPGLVLEKAVWKATESLEEQQHGRPFRIDHTSVPGYVVVARLRPGEQVVIDTYSHEAFIEQAPNLGA
jgi:hypothetical protein